MFFIYYKYKHTQPSHAGYKNKKHTKAIFLLAAL